MTYVFLGLQLQGCPLHFCYLANATLLHCPIATGTQPQGQPVGWRELRCRPCCQTGDHWAAGHVLKTELGQKSCFQKIKYLRMFSLLNGLELRAVQRVFWRLHTLCNCDAKRELFCSNFMNPFFDQYLHRCTSIHTCIHTYIFMDVDLKTHTHPNL